MNTRQNADRPARSYPGARHRARPTLRSSALVPVLVARTQRVCGHGRLGIVTARPILVAAGALATCAVLALTTSAFLASPFSPATLLQRFVAEAEAGAAATPNATTTAAITPPTPYDTASASRIEVVRATSVPMTLGKLPNGPALSARGSAAVIDAAEKQIQSGNIEAARSTLSQAVFEGDARATLALAETYDPQMLAAWGVRIQSADASMASALYGRALAAGIEHARVRLEALQ